MPTTVEDALKMLAANAERTAQLERTIDRLLLENALMARQVSRLSKRVSAQRRRIARFHEERDMAKIAAEYDLDPIGDMAADLRKTTPST